MSKILVGQTFVVTYPGMVNLSAKKWWKSPLKSERRKLLVPHFFQNCGSFQSKSADVVLKTTIILKEMRIAQLCSENEQILV